MNSFPDCLVNDLLNFCTDIILHKFVVELVGISSVGKKNVDKLVFRVVPDNGAGEARVPVTGTGGFFTGGTCVVGESFRLVETQASAVLLRRKLCTGKKVYRGGIDDLFSTVLTAV